jgi:hypothetical protein
MPFYPKLKKQKGFRKKVFKISSLAMGANRNFRKPNIMGSCYLKIELPSYLDPIFKFLQIISFSSLSPNSWFISFKHTFERTKVVSFVFIQIRIE